MRLWSAAAVAVLVLLAGCGGDDSSDADSPSATGTSSPTAGEKAAEAPSDVCAVLSDADVSAAVGATLTANQDPGGGCTYKPEDPRDLSVSVTVLSAAEGGGFDSYVSGIGASYKKFTKKDLPGVGDRAVVASGETVYGGSHQAASVAEAGGLLVTANALGGTDEVLADAAAKTLTIAVEKLG